MLVVTESDNVIKWHLLNRGARSGVLRLFRNESGRFYRA
jgi:hypothetical protein